MQQLAFLYDAYVFKHCQP